MVSHWVLHLSRDFGFARPRCRNGAIATKKGLLSKTLGAENETRTHAPRGWVRELLLTPPTPERGDFGSSAKPGGKNL